MATEKHTLSRRQTIADIGLARAIQQPDRAAWDAALADYRAKETKFEALWADHTQAEEAWSAAHPRIDRFFDEYRLGIGMKRERVIDALRFYAHDNATPIDEQAIADEFMAYQQQNRDTKKRFRVDEAEEAARAYGESDYFPARDALMAVPAPDNAALLIKIEITAVSTGGEYAEAALADARRLLATGRA